MLTNEQVDRMVELSENSYMDMKDIDHELQKLGLVFFIDDEETTLSYAARVIFSDSFDVDKLRYELIEFNGLDKVKLYVNVYEVTRRYGGSEEGGWYFNNYDFVTCEEVTGFNYAHTIKERLEKEYEEKNEGDIFSVSGGVLYVVEIESEKAKSETVEIPHYE